MQNSQKEVAPVRQPRSNEDLWMLQEEFKKNYINERATEVLRHFTLLNSDENIDPQLQINTYHGIPIISISQPTAILEVGSGMGGVTKAYKALFPEAVFFSIDKDPRAATAVLEQQQFIQGDVTQFATEQEIVAQLDSESDTRVDHMVALKTNADVILHLVKLWMQNPTTFSLLFSYIDGEINRDDMREIEEQLAKVSKENKAKLYFHDGRDYKEIAWVLKSAT